MKKNTKSAILPIHVLYDEFGHSSIPHFEDIITKVRKYQVSISMILQDFAQLKAHYGESGVKTILGGGTVSKLFFKGVDMEMARIVEGILGKVKIDYKLNTGEIASKEENLMNDDRVRTMKDGKAIFITSNKEPIRLNTKPYFTQKRFRFLKNFPSHPFPTGDTKELEYITLNDQKGERT